MATRPPLRACLEDSVRATWGSLWQVMVLTVHEKFSNPLLSVHPFADFGVSKAHVSVKGSRENSEKQGLAQLPAAHLILPFILPRWRVSTRCPRSFRASSSVQTICRGILAVARVYPGRSWPAGGGRGSPPPHGFDPLRCKDSLSPTIRPLQQPGKRVEPVQQQTHLLLQVLRAVRARGSIPALGKHPIDRIRYARVCAPRRMPRQHGSRSWAIS